MRPLPVSLSRPERRPRLNRETCRQRCPSYREWTSKNQWQVGMPACDLPIAPRFSGSPAAMSGRRLSNDLNFSCISTLETCVLGPNPPAQARFRRVWSPTGPCAHTFGLRHYLNLRARQPTKYNHQAGQGQVAPIGSSFRYLQRLSSVKPLRHFCLGAFLFSSNVAPVVSPTPSCPCATDMSSMPSQGLRLAGSKSPPFILLQALSNSASSYRAPTICLRPHRCATLESHRDEVGAP